MFYIMRGYKSFEGSQKSSKDFYQNKINWQVIDINDSRAGDIIAYFTNETPSDPGGHVEILAEPAKATGIYYVYNCGDNNTIQTPGTNEFPEACSTSWASKYEYVILRPPAN